MRWPQKIHLYSSKYNFVYCPIPKVACSSIKSWMLALHDVPQHQIRPNVHGFVGREFALRYRGCRQARAVLNNRDIFKFAVVRNPWSRLVSAYLDKVVPAKQPACRLIQETRDRRNGRRRFISSNWFSAGLVSPHHFMLRRWPEGNLEHGVTFREFIEHLSTANIWRMNEHWRPQHLFLTDAEFDFIARFETLASDFGELGRQLGISTSLAKRHSTNYSSAGQFMETVADWSPRQLMELPAYPTFTHFYTPDLVDLVATKYHREIEMFGYEF